MEDQSVVERAQSLSDLELAILLSLIAQQHCIIGTDLGAVDVLTDELALIASKTFGLSHAVVECSQRTTLDEFGHAILVDHGPVKPASAPRSNGTDHQGSYFQSRQYDAKFEPLSLSALSENGTENKKIANIVIAKNLDLAGPNIQIQALELMRTKRIYTRTAVHNAPKRFLIIAVLANELSGPRLASHLNDYMFISHYHSPVEGFYNVEDGQDADADSDSTSSVVKKPSSADLPDKIGPMFSSEEIEGLTRRSQNAIISVEIKRYIQNIVIFLRMHRAVGGGISAQATQHFDLLTKCLAPLHSLSYVTPSLVSLAARKVYPHRIEVTSPKDERSMQWGSDVEAVAVFLEGITPADVIEDVLNTVEVPL